MRWARWSCGPWSRVPAPEPFTQPDSGVFVVILQIVVFVLGAILLLLGYSKTHRNHMLLGAMLMVATLAVPDFVRGFQQGFAESQRAHQADAE